MKTGTKVLLINIEASRFSNGEGKLIIKDSVRGKNLFILSDIGNYNLGYEYHGQKHILSPEKKPISFY